MRMRSKLVWKLSAAVMAILAVAIALCGFADNLICTHYSLESARAFLRFNSESIINGIGRLMMSRNNEGVGELLVELSADSAVYGDIRLTSHPSGEVVASRFGRVGTRLDVGDRACAACHNRDDLDPSDMRIVDSVIADPEEGRVLSVTAPIFNKPGCRSAACHVHDTGPAVLGFLNADYSLSRMDAKDTDRRLLILATVLASLLLGIVALRIMFTRLLERPISRLIAGTKQIAAGRLDFRFEQHRSDEIGDLEEAFNSMTARIQAHRGELRTTMEYLGGIVENSADIIITATPEGVIETFNRGAEKALGYSRTELIGRPVGLLFADPRQREVAIARLKDADSVRNFETAFLTKEGRIRDVLLTLSYLRDRNGNAIGTLGISKDITQRKKLQRELLQSQKLAAIGNAAAGIQHAIKNMLNALKGGAYVVRTGISRDDANLVEEGWAMVDEGIERIGLLSENMLRHAKEWKPELQRVDLNDLAIKVCAMNRQIAVEKGVTLHHNLPEGLPAVLCDPKLIHLAMTDILINAIDACDWKEYGPDESPEVVLRSSVSEDGGFFVIEVRDNGCGMSEDVQQSIFTPFFSTKKSWGTGLGLALTSRIINVHGGSVAVESEPEVGTTFRIHLPLEGPVGPKEPADGQADSHH
ncbi:MAG: ATP-binding protein [Planctomycetota bacterium]